jgi:hypothetical protein
VALALVEGQALEVAALPGEPAPVKWNNPGGGR